VQSGRASLTLKREATGFPQEASATLLQVCPCSLSFIATVIVFDVVHFLTYV
jgi:hypothetical protein